MRKNVPKDATIADVLSELDQPEDYVRQVFGNMTPIFRQHGAAVVRIGTTGTGFSPHYRIDPGDGFNAATAKFGLDGSEPDADANDYFEAHFVAFDGRNHQQRGEWGSGTLMEQNWSEGRMTYDEVKALLGKIRGLL